MSARPRGARELLALGWLAGLAGVLLWTRLTGLGVSFWRDEVYSVVHYAGRGPHAIWFGHYIPNDHVLFNFLAWTAAGLFGRTEAVYRLWSVAPATVAIGLIAWWLWRSWSRWLAVTFAVLAVTSPLHLELAKQARGYGLGFLAGAVMLISATSIARGRARRGAFAGLAGAGLIGTWTLTGFLIAFVGQLLSLLPARAARRSVLVVAGVVAAGTLVFYAPLLHVFVDPLEHRNYFGASTGNPLGWSAFLTGPPQQFLGPTSELLLYVSSSAVYTVVGLALAGVGGAALWRSGQRHVLIALVSPLVVTEVALTVLAVNFNPRFVSFLMFHFLLLVSFGTVATGRLLVRLVRASAPVALAGAAVAVLLTVRTVELNDHWDAAPIENAKVVAQIVRRAGFTSVVTDSLKPWSLRFYLGRSHVNVLAPEQLEAAFCRGRGPLAYVDQLAYAEVMYAGDPVRPMPISVACLRARGARLLIVPERNAPERYRGLPVHVWLVCAPALAVGVAACGGSQRAATTVKVKLTRAPRSPAFACGKRKDFWQYAAQEPVGVAGKVRPSPAGRWHAKVKVKRCTGSAFQEFRKLRATLGGHGTFGVTFTGLPSGYYELRAEVTTAAGRTDSRRVFFHVAS